MDDDISRADRAKSGSPYLNTAQAAHYLRVSVRTMQRMRAGGRGPAPRRHDRIVQYHIDDLQAWSLTRVDGPKS